MLKNRLKIAKFTIIKAVYTSDIKPFKDFIYIEAKKGL